jgi:hypothetical protein
MNTNPAPLVALLFTNRHRDKRDVATTCITNERAPNMKTPPCWVKAYHTLSGPPPQAEQPATAGKQKQTYAHAMGHNSNSTYTMCGSRGASTSRKRGTHKLIPVTSSPIGHWLCTPQDYDTQSSSSGQHRCFLFLSAGPKTRYSQTNTGDQQPNRPLAVHTPRLRHAVKQQRPA